MQDKIFKRLLTFVCCILLIICSYNNGFNAGKKQGEIRVIYQEVPKVEFKPFIDYKKGEKAEPTPTPTETPKLEKAKATPQPTVAPTLEAEPTTETGLVSLGWFTSYGYDACYSCCGKTPEHPAYGMTRSGTRAIEGRTIAVDPSVIPLGSEVIINGHTYIAEDTGSGIKGKKIDVYYSTHSAAFNHGRQSVEVFVRR